MSRKHKVLTWKEKLGIIGKAEKKPQKKHVDLTCKLGVPVSTLNTIIWKRDEIQRNSQVFGINVKQTRCAQHGKIEEILLPWFKEVRATGMNVNKKVLREKADEIMPSSGMEDLQALGRWVNHFKTGHGFEN